MLQKLVYVETNKIAEFQLVGTLEANPKENKISVESPVGKAIREREKGDVVLVKTPNKSFTVEIMDLSNEMA